METNIASGQASIIIELKAALVEARDWLIDKAEITNSYCEICERHAPKDAAGNITGPLLHRQECVITKIDDALLRDVR